MCGIAGLALQPVRRRHRRRCWRRWPRRWRIAGRTGTGTASSGAPPWCRRGWRSSTCRPATSRCSPAPRRWWPMARSTTTASCSPGLPLATGSDCEPPLHLWRQSGGGYADGAARHVRHRHPRPRQPQPDADARPVRHQAAVLRHHPGGLAFASEPQALLAAGLVRAGVRPAARDELLQMQFTTGADTIFPGIQRVLPGETLRAVDGHVVDRQRLRSAAARAAGGDRRGGGAGPAGRGAGAVGGPAPAQRRAVRHVPVGRRRQRGRAVADGAAERRAGAGLHRRLRRARRRRRARAGRRAGPRGGRPARDGRGHGGDGVGAPAPHRGRDGRPGGRLRHHPVLVPGAARRGRT